MSVIRVRDRAENITNDTDFFNLLRRELGDDAAEWYQDRIMEIDNAIGPIRHNRVKKTEEKYWWKVTNALMKLPVEILQDIAIAANEIRGWDE